VGDISWKMDCRKEEPILWEAYGEGGTQGLDWHDASLRVDSEGDAAHSFLIIPYNQSHRPRGAYPPLRSRL
jgi:hypothetical protein